MGNAQAKLARDHLVRAEPHIPDGDETQALTWLHLAAEAAVEALAQVHGFETMKLHQRKAKVARELYEQGLFSVNLQATLLMLNDARKSTNYGSDEVDLEGRTLVGLYDEISTAVDEAEAGS